jgi:hypothetical protein
LAVAAAISALAMIVVGPPAASADAPTAPPPVTVLTHGNVGNGDFFVSPFSDQSTYANGPEILDQNGNTVWFKPIPQGQEASDFRTQTYRGRPVLTWWQGTGLGDLSNCVDYIYNDHYQQIATVQAGNGLSADGHEFLITPQNTALITAYTTRTANLTSIGGAPDQTVIDCIVQEIDIKTGKVLFQWDAADHVPYSQTEVSLPESPSEPWDWIHINAVKLDTDGNLLIDGRATWTGYKVDRHSGKILWQLGGKASSFKLQAAPGQSLDEAGEITAWQHDFESQGNGIYTFFDNERVGTGEFPYSRAVTVKVDPRSHTATLIKSFDQPEHLGVPGQGNSQRTADGNTVVGWGTLPYFSEFDAYGDLLYNAKWPTGVDSYRTYLLPWNPGRDGGHAWPGHGGWGQGPHYTPVYQPAHGGHHHDRDHHGRS